MKQKYRCVVSLVAPLTALIIIIHSMTLKQPTRQTAREATPSYNLLFSIDLNGEPYSSPSSTGFVVRVLKQKPMVIFTGHTLDMATSVPNLYICDAATGMLHKIEIEGTGEILERGTTSFVPVPTPELDSLLIDDSTTAPDGYSLRGVDFRKTYNVTSQLVKPFPHFSESDILRLFPTNGSVDDAYKSCLEQVAGSSDPIVHFIGWIMSTP